MNKELQNGFQKNTAWIFLLLTVIGTALYVVN